MSEYRSPPEFQGFPEPAPTVPPIFNLPSVIVLVAALLIGIQAAMVWLFSDEFNREILLTFSFIPAYFTLSAAELPVPAARYWSYLSYAFLHGSWTHVFINVFWLLAFGSVVARRYTNRALIIYWLLAAASGAAMHFMFHPGELVPVIGASAVLSACMGTVTRFVFSGTGFTGANVASRRGMSLYETLTNRSALIFAGFWMAINYLMGSGIIPIFGPGASIAWEAHIGGFLFGFFAFGLFEIFGKRVHHHPESFRD